MTFHNALFGLIAAFCTLAVVSCTSPEQSSGAYKTKLGTYAVKTKDKVTLTDSEQGRDITMRVVYPVDEGDGSFPVIVYSHGAFCYTQMYANVVEHWASHGYIIVLPEHLDSPNLKERPDLTQRDLLLLSRVRDMSFVLDSLDDIETAVPAIEGKTDRENMAVAGHSFGGMITMIKAGLPLKDSQTGETMDLSDDRFDAAVVMSGVSEMQDMADGAFASLTGPVFASGGTLDLGNVGDGVTHPWEWRMGGYRLAPPGDKYEVVLDKGDHYLGGLICRENRGGVPDIEGVMIVNGMSTAFLDAYLKNDSKAKTFIQTADAESLTRGRAMFDRK